jgi:hypothetical protein
MKAYLVKRSGNGECFLKVGVTRLRDTSNRHHYEKTKLVDSDLPFEEQIHRMLKGEKHVPDDSYPEVQELAVAEFDHDSQALFLEHYLITQFKHIQYFPKQSFTGRTECFVYTRANRIALKEAFDRYTNQINGTPSNRVLYSLFALDIQDQDELQKHRRIMRRIASNAKS